MEGKHRWEFKREISIGDILLAVTVAVAVGLPFLTWALGIEKRVSVLEDRVAYNWRQQEHVDAIQDAQLRDAMADIKSSLRIVQNYVMEQRFGVPNGQH